MTAAGSSDPKKGPRFPAAFAIGLAVVSVLAIVFLIATHSLHPTPPSREAVLPFGPAERSYADNIRFKKLEMSESSNMLNQKFTYLNGVVANNGARAVPGLDVVVEFHDPFNQVILREKHRVISPNDLPLRPGEQRDFQFAFEDIPAEWNRQYPAIRVTGLVLR